MPRADQRRGRAAPPALRRPGRNCADPRGRLDQTLLGKARRSDRLDQRIAHARDGPVEQVVAEAQGIGAGGYRTDGTLLHAYGRADGLHLEGVRHHHAG